MSKVIDENGFECKNYLFYRDYFKWLCSLVDADNETGSYIYLMRELFEEPFDFGNAELIPNDDNRIKDGLILREEFLEENNLIKKIRIVGPCSLLEMMIKLAERMEDLFCEYDYIYWFWEMIRNLEFICYDDSHIYWAGGRECPEEIDVGIYKLVKRDYSFDGIGSLFPRKCVKKDMRKTEIWYQMNSYLVEKYMK